MKYKSIVGLCMTPGCGREGCLTRGICQNCYRVATKLVKGKAVTWKELEAAGKVQKPRAGGRGLGVENSPRWDYFRGKSASLASAAPVPVSAPAVAGGVDGLLAVEPALVPLYDTHSICGAGIQ
jgi:hypothetical protein